MSIKRLNIEEHARYLIGEAVMRRIEKSERDPASIADIRALRNWIEAWLTDDELDAVTFGAGLILRCPFQGTARQHRAVRRQWCRRSVLIAPWDAPALRHSRAYSAPLAVISANSRARLAALRAAFLSS